MFHASVKQVLLTTLNLPLVENIFTGVEQYHDTHHSDLCSLMATLENNFAERKSHLTVGVWFGYGHVHLPSLGQTVPLLFDSYNALATDLRAAAPRLSELG